MSECTSGELRDLLPDLVNDRLQAAMRQRVEAHAGSCTECAAELALLRALRPALLREPAIDAQRVAAAVRARTAASGESPHRAPARAGLATRWRVAIAAAALLGVGAIGYAANTHRSIGSPEVAVAPIPEKSTQDTDNASRLAPRPALAPVPAPERKVAATPPHAATPSAATSLATTGVLDNVSDLSDDEVRALTASLDHLSALPEADPSPGVDPLGASLDDASAGGR
jgi:anti-sigma factor RsiW